MNTSEAFQILLFQLFFNWILETQNSNCKIWAWDDSVFVIFYMQQKNVHMMHEIYHFILRRDLIPTYSKAKLIFFLKLTHMIFLKQDNMSDTELKQMEEARAAYIAAVAVAQENPTVETLAAAAETRGKLEAFVFWRKERRSEAPAILYFWLKLLANYCAVLVIRASELVKQITISLCNLYTFISIWSLLVSSVFNDIYNWRWQGTDKDHNNHP